MILTLLLVSMLVLCLLGMPLVFALLGSSVITLLVARPDLPWTILPQLFVSGIDSYALLAIPLFFLAGELMTASGVIDRILLFARSLMGHRKGGLGQASILSSVIMSGVSGSAVADAAAIGPIMIRAMHKEGYPRSFAAALIETSATIAVIIPPSIPFIIYAVLANVSIGAMFLAGIVPGLLMAVGLAVVVRLSADRLHLPRSVRADWATAARATWHASLALLAPVIIVGGIRAGIFTATEAGAIAVVYVTLIGTLLYRALAPRAVLHSLIRAAHGTASVIVILGASSIFAWIIADQEIGKNLAEFIREMDPPAWALLFLINLLFFAVGTVLEPLPALIIVVPVFLPMAEAIGMDPVHFGVMTVLNLVLGLCTPPVGALIFMTASMAEVSAMAVVRASMPFLGVLLIVLALVTYVPALTLGLPALVGGR